jgi:HK97 family phage major capsid protein
VNKELRELLAQIENKKAEARKLLDENKIDEAKALKDEIVKLQEQFDIAKEIYEDQSNKMKGQGPIDTTPRDEKKEFINHVRTKFRNAMSERSNEDGGYTVPQDIQTRINELRESKDALRNLVTVEPVSTLSGSRVFKKRAQQTGFVEVQEGGNIPESATPQFTNLTYQVKKYAGFLKATNELLADSDQAIEDVIVRWIGDEARVTDNKLILAELDKKPKVAISNPDDIKDILNVQLDPAFRNTVLVVTNQDGYNWLDKLKDNDGNYLLQPSISSPSGKQLFGVNVIVVSNKDLPSADDKAPMIIGDLKEGIVLFDRQQVQINATNVGGDAYLTDVTLFRAILREEVKTRDEEAFVYGQVELTPTV